LEEVEQPGLPVAALEHVLRVDLDHGQPAPFGVERVPGAGEGLLLDEQFLPRRTPLGARDDLRKRHGSSCATVPLQEVTAGVTGTHRWGREILAAPGGRGGAGRGQGRSEERRAGGEGW